MGRNISDTSETFTHQINLELIHLTEKFVCVKFMD